MVTNITPLSNFPPLPSYSSALLLSDPYVYDIYGEPLIRQFPFPTEVFLAPRGEQAKSLSVAQNCWEEMRKAGMDRSSVVITLGGGSLCDLGGFVASTYMRGIALIHCPTTFLAMVDASIGGKSALNFGGEKNLVGTLYCPQLVVADLQTLSTLDPEEMRAGYAEVVKMGMLFDPELLEMEALQEIVERCTSIKESVCQEGERRDLLNWGHTFAHAIEALTDYEIRHGEAVAIGMSCAAHLSVELGFADSSLIAFQEEALERRGLSSALPDLNPGEIVRLMGRDKKSWNGEITCVVSRGIGQMELHRGVDPSHIERALREHEKFYLSCS